MTGWKFVGAALCVLLVVSAELPAQKSKVLTDFEDEAQLKVMRGSEEEGYADLELSSFSEAVTSGTYALKVTFHKNIMYPGIAGNPPGGFLTDWQGYDYVRLDVYNPAPKLLSCGIRIDDAQSTGYPTRYNGGVTLRPGPSTIELHLPSLKVQDGSRDLDLGRITAFMIFFVDPKEDVVLYFDHLRLEKSPEIVHVEGLFRFDFGPEKAPVFPGFHAVSPKSEYTDDGGFGWVGAEGLSAGRQGWPDALAGDYVHGDTYGRWEFPFTLKVPNGLYTVWLIARNIDQNGMPSRSWRVLAEGKTVIDEVMTPERFYSKEVLYRWLDTDYHFGIDAWATYVEPRFAPRTAEVTVSDGRLDLVFDTCAVSALIVYPTAKQADVAPVLAQLEKDRKKEFHDKHYYEQLPEPERPVAEALKGHEDDPAVIFTPHYLRPIHPRSVPLEEEDTNVLTLWAAPGETEPGTFAILAQENLKDLRVKAFELTPLLPGGNLPNIPLEVRLVRYTPRPAGTGIFTPRGGALLPPHPIDVEKGMTRQYWVTVRVPEAQTESAMYKGKVEVTFTANGEAQEIPVLIVLEVLPVRLATAEETDVSFGWYYSNPGGLNYFFDRFEGMEARWWWELNAEMADMRAHGSTAIQLPSPTIPTVNSDGTIEVDFSRLTPWVTAMRFHGLGLKHTNQMNILGLANYRLMRSGLKEFSPEFNRAYKELIAQIVAWSESKRSETQREKIPLVIWAVDEPREQLINDWNRNLADTIKYLKLIAQVPGARSTVTPMGDAQNGLDYMPMVPEMDIIQTHPWERSAKMIAYAQEHEKPVLWTYNAGIDRLSFGFGVWRLRAKGRWQWHYQWHTFPFDPFDTGWGVVYASPDGPLSTVGYEWTREGIDDYRYLYTLQQEMERAGPDDRLLLEQSRRLLDEIRREVPPWPTEGLESGEEVGLAYGGPINAKLDGWRRSIAELILKFQKGTQ